MENIIKFSEDKGIRIVRYKLTTIDRCFCMLFAFKSIYKVINSRNVFFVSFFSSILNSIYP